jgi:monofunctional chorismate mutase
MDDRTFILHRKKIDEIDHELVKLIGERLDSAKEIGKYKKKNGIKIVDKKREKEILNDRIKNSRLSKEFTKKLFSVIIHESRRVQK